MATFTQTIEPFPVVEIGNFKKILGRNIFMYLENKKILQGKIGHPNKILTSKLQNPNHISLN